MRFRVLPLWTYCVLLLIALVSLSVGWTAGFFLLVLVSSATTAAVLMFLLWEMLRQFQLLRRLSLSQRHWLRLRKS